MRLACIALATALLASGAAWADDSVTNVNLGGDANGTLSAHFGVTHVAEGAFTDTFNFTPTHGAWMVDSSLVTIGFQPGSNVDFHVAEINGQRMRLWRDGAFEYGYMLNEPIEGPLVLRVWGNVEGMMGAASASYSGTINISPIPEPMSYGMLLGGMGILTWVARRKRP